MLPSVLKQKAAIKTAYETISKIQAKCSHPEQQLEKQFEGNTGGYDGPAFDTYSAHFNCLRCGKRWGADSKENPKEYCREAKVVKNFSN